MTSPNPATAFLRGKATAMPQKKIFSAADAPQAGDFTAFPEACRVVGE
ncbi:MAG: hypothetical protein CAPSK01_004148 [Candidatus Accumulibacter vicinus]|uniref:Uncharacterized protein n=1 Tax=Candidatus Accumulibacter vicinus TaxID=2954382 RepID=A0A084XVY3_9PROT|nr:MAG: hypothetical protein CAPSK01_004148 [Candidatus Accumulibacter vicinus]